MARSSLLFAAAALAIGCATVRDTVNDTLGLGDGNEPQQHEIFFSAVEGLPIHATEAPSSKVVGRLKLHERVTRSQQEHGYAYVSTGRGISGWVNNAQLLWRLPEASQGAAPATVSEPERAPAKAPDAAKPADATPAPEAASPAAVTSPALEAAPSAPAAEPLQPAAAPGAPEPALPAAPPPPPHRPRPATFDPF